MSDWDLRVGTTRGGDLARLLGSQVLHPEPDSPRLFPRAALCGTPATPNLAPQPSASRWYKAPYTRACDRPGLPSAVLFGDSYSNALARHLGERFRRITIIRGPFDRAQLEAILAAEPIDVVIEEKVGRHLPHDAVLAAYREGAGGERP